MTDGYGHRLRAHLLGLLVLAETRVDHREQRSRETVLAVGAREGWRAVACSRQDGAFRLMEIWLENRLLLEVLTPEDQAGYRAFMSPGSPDGLFARSRRMRWTSQRSV